MNDVVVIEFLKKQNKKKNRAGFKEGIGSINWKVIRNTGWTLPLYLPFFCLSASNFLPC